MVAQLGFDDQLRWSLTNDHCIGHFILFYISRISSDWSQGQILKPWFIGIFQDLKIPNPEDIGSSILKIKDS